MEKERRNKSDIKTEQIGVTDGSWFSLAWWEKHKDVFPETLKAEKILASGMKERLLAFFAANEYVICKKHKRSNKYVPVKVQPGVFLCSLYGVNIEKYYQERKIAKVIFDLKIMPNEKGQTNRKDHKQK